MLFLLIPVIWLALAAFVVCLCRGAAQADAVAALNSERNREAGLELTLSSPAAARTTRHRGVQHRAYRMPPRGLRGTHAGR
jgi:hypothetical protein